MLTNYMAPPEYFTMTAAEVASKSNGCGPEGESWKDRLAFDLIPGKVFGIDIEEPCRIHDIEYGLGRNKPLADSRLGGNLVLACLLQKPHMLAEFMLVVAAYVQAVSAAGDEHFGTRS